MAAVEVRMTSYRIIGTPTPRQDAAGKVTGATRYAADIQLPRMLHAKVLRSPFAHARILRVDTSRARALPGVVAVVTADDLPPGEVDSAVRTREVFAREEVVYHMQPVAAVAAETIAIAEEAIDLIVVDYEELPVVLDAAAALAADSPRARLDLDAVSNDDGEAHMTIDLGAAAQASEQRGNAVSRLRFRRGDVDAGFAEAAIVVEGRFEAAMVHQAPLEPQVALAAYDGRLTVWSPTQGQFHQRDEIAAVLGLPVSRVRLIPTEMGGGFGARVAPLVHPIAGLLAMTTGRPVKLVLTRREELACGVPAQHTMTDAKIGAAADGTLTTIQARVIFDSGAYPSGLGLASVMVAGCYRYANLDVESVKVLTNKVSTGAYRAPGAPEVMFAVEQLVDEIARRLGIDPIDLRRRNAVREGDLMPNGKRWPRIGFVECLDALEASAFWQGRHDRLGRRGIGVAIGGWLGGFQPATALVRLDERGQIAVITGANDTSGTNTTFAMIAAEVLGLDLGSVIATTADTDSAPFAGMVTGSKATYSYGPAVKAAAEDARRQIVAIVARELDTAVDGLVVKGGAVTDPATGSSMTFRQIAGLSMTNGARYAPVLGHGGEVLREVAPGFTAQAVEVSVDDATGAVTLTGAVAVQDVGTAINPLAVVGQLEGGVVQAFGMGLTEELLYDDHGRLRNGSFLDYRLLTALDVPRIETVLVEVPSAEGPYGARIVGEPPIIAGSAAIGNALRDLTGVRYTSAPITPERVVQGLRAREPVSR